MGFQEEPGKIIWKIHFSSSIEKVYFALTTDEGRKTFWAEETNEKDESIEFTFLNYPKIEARVLGRRPFNLFRLTYFDTDVTFKLAPTRNGGTDLTLINLVEDAETRKEMTAGWVSVLLAMKAAVDFDVDLRNHHSDRTWDKGYLDN